MEVKSEYWGILKIEEAAANLQGGICDILHDLNQNNLLELVAHKYGSVLSLAVLALVFWKSHL